MTIAGSVSLQIAWVLGVPVKKWPPAHFDHSLWPQAAFLTDVIDLNWVPWKLKFENILFEAFLLSQTVPYDF